MYNALQNHSYFFSRFIMLQPQPPGCFIVILYKNVYIGESEGKRHLFHIFTAVIKILFEVCICILNLWVKTWQNHILQQLELQVLWVYFSTSLARSFQIQLKGGQISWRSFGKINI